MADESAQLRKVVKAREVRAPGRVVRVDLGDGRCAYGRRLVRPNVEFYDRPGRTGEAIDLLDLVTSPVAFTVWVMDSAFRRKGRWKLLDVVPLLDEERTVVQKRFKQDLFTCELSIYWSDPVTETWGEVPATAQECEGLEAAAVWEPKHIEDRLRDHFDGCPNKWVESLRLKL